MVNVMLIDDHPVVRAGLRAILNTFSDVEVVMEGSTGADVDKLFTADAPQVDAVVCDIQMPDVDGIAATKLSLIHISEPTRPSHISRMPSSA